MGEKQGGRKKPQECGFHSECTKAVYLSQVTYIQGALEWPLQHIPHSTVCLCIEVGTEWAVTGEKPGAPWQTTPCRLFLIRAQVPLEVPACPAGSVLSRLKRKISRLSLGKELCTQGTLLGRVGNLLVFSSPGALLCHSFAQEQSDLAAKRVA